MSLYFFCSQLFESFVIACCVVTYLYVLINHSSLIIQQYIYHSLHLASIK